MGKGSLDFAKKLPGEQNAPPLLPPRPGDSSPNLLASAKRDVCCKRVNCITRFQAFNNISLDKDNINETTDKL